MTEVIALTVFAAIVWMIVGLRRVNAATPRRSRTALPAGRQQQALQWPPVRPVVSPVRLAGVNIDATAALATWAAAWLAGQFLAVFILFVGGANHVDQAPLSIVFASTAAAGWALYLIGMTETPGPGFPGHAGVIG